MPVIKTIQFDVYDIKYGVTTIWFEGTKLYIRRGYELRDVDDFVIPNIGLKTWQEGIEWNVIPQNIRDALTEISDYSIAKINQTEGIV